MAEGGYREDLSRSTLMGSEDGDLSPSSLMGSENGDISRSILMGSQDCYQYYCQPCDVDHNQVEATFYCINCHEYMCRKCSMYHKKFKEMNDHDILDVKTMTYKPPVRAVTSAATHVKDINVTYGGYISSSALMSTNQLLVADRLNKKVRLVDTVSGSQVSEKLSDDPWQVTRISDTEAAVTLPYHKKIVLLRTQPQLSVVREISVQQCHGIAYMDNRLIVSSWKGNVDILDMSGKVLRNIYADESGRKTFNFPQYITVDPVTGSMFVSYYGEDRRERCSVVKLSKEGSVLATYNGDGMGYPSQAALDDQGMLYVAWRDATWGFSGCVEQLSANCDKTRTIIPDLARYWPEALSYDEATQQLYVGQSNGVVKVYKLS